MKSVNAESLFHRVALVALVLGCSAEVTKAYPQVHDESTPVKVYSQSGWCVWCPTPTQLPDGRFALVHSRWPESAGFEAWCMKSEIALAIADGPLGPYRFVGTLLGGAKKSDAWDRDVTHNPYLFAHGGKYYLYYMGTRGIDGDRKSFLSSQRIGVAVADRVEGPWQRAEQPVFPEDPRRAMCSNPSVCAMPDGRILMVYKWMVAPWSTRPEVHLGAAIAERPEGPFEIVNEDVFPAPGVRFAGEDPCLWVEGDTIVCVIHDIGTNYSSSSRALIRFESKDGINWMNRGALLARGGIHRLERPYVLSLSDGGRLLFAASKPSAAGESSQIVAYPGLLSAADPKNENRPETWFHLIGGNVSKEGIVKDLDAIAVAGFSGIQFFHGQFGGPWSGVKEQIPCLSPKWEDILRFTATEAKRRGLDFTLQNCPGWSYAGGPWIEAKDSMRVLDAVRRDVKDGVVDVTMPKGFYPAFEGDKRCDWRDLKVIAFPKLAGEADSVRPVDFKPVHLADTNSPAEFKYDLGREMTVRSVVFENPKKICWCWQSNPVTRIELFAMTDGGELKIGDWKLPMMSWQDAQPLTLSVPATRFRRCRFRFTYKSALHLDGIAFLGEARVRSWESEAGYTNRELMKGGDPTTAEGEAVDPKRIVDLTAAMSSDGHLRTTLPEGEWTILRIGHVSNGFINAPAPKEATGFECDKLSPAAAKRHFENYTGRLAAKGAPLDGRLDGVLVDSWECGFQNWTEGLDASFSKQYGSSLDGWWPALFGYVVKDREASRAFFRDWRNHLSRKLTDGFYKTTAELIHSVGGKFWCEVGPGEVFPGDPMEYFKHADVPMCEFWLPFAKAGAQNLDHPAERYSMACVSAAHVYGKRRVAAESFTSCLTWNEDFKLMKESMDAFFSLGVTYPVFHTYTHNPATDLPPPGTSFGEGSFGAPFLRGQTWWPYMRHFTDYLTRCTGLLERGVPANDVLMYLGDDVNALPRTAEDGTFEHPAGFAIDYLNHDALMNRLAFTHRRVVSPEGAAWRAIWIPEGTYLSAETERRLAEAEVAGVPVKRGAGTVAAFLAEKGLEKDFDDPSGMLRYIHRKDGAVDIYFVCVNRRSGGFSGPVAFGAKGAAVVYDPVADRASPWNGKTLSLAPGGSCFVIFGDASFMARTSNGAGSALRVDEISSWSLSFPPGWGAPALLQLDKLVPWCELPVSDEAKAFSGTAVYRAKFRGKFAKLDLGTVETIAEVKVNGRAAGVLWCEPYVADIGALCTDGENELEIAVTSTWHNRIWFDGQLPEAQRKTWTLPSPPNMSAGKPLPVGLLGNAAVLNK